MENGFEISAYVERIVETKEEKTNEKDEIFSLELQYHRQPIPLMSSSIYNINITKDKGIQKKVLIPPSNNSNFATLGSKVQSFLNFY
jgi:hypothetical protein